MFIVSTKSLERKHNSTCKSEGHELTSPTFSNCRTRRLISDTVSGGLSAFTADNSKHGYPSPRMLHKMVNVTTVINYACQEIG